MRDAEREQAGLTLAERAAATDLAGAELRFAGAPAANGKRVTAADRNRHRAAPGDSRLRRAVAEAWLDAPAQLHAARDPVDPPDELTVGTESLPRQQHRVRQPHTS